MDLRRPSVGEWLAGLAGLLLIVSLFLPWYSAGGQSATAWQTMSVDDVILALAGLVGVAALVIATNPRLTGFAVAATTLGGLPALLALILALFRVLSPAPPVDVSLGAGAWLGLVSALALVAGCWAGSRDEGPARRNAAAGDRAAREALARTEVLSLPPDAGAASAGSTSG